MRVISFEQKHKAPGSSVIVVLLFNCDLFKGLFLFLSFFYSILNGYLVFVGDSLNHAEVHLCVH